LYVANSEEKGMKGRSRKPTHLKIVSGTLRKHRENDAEPVAAGGWPETPGWLSGGAAVIFVDTCGRMAALGTLSPEWADAIADYASCLDEAQRATIVIEDLGATYALETKAGGQMFRARPEVAMRADAMRRAQSLRAELGLGPASKSKVSAKPPAEENPFLVLDRTSR
jgi:P27 family predicted phage terminase small subunit